MNHNDPQKVLLQFTSHCEPDNKHSMLRHIQAYEECHKQLRGSKRSNASSSSSCLSAEELRSQKSLERKEEPIEQQSTISSPASFTLLVTYSMHRVATLIADNYTTLRTYSYRNSLIPPGRRRPLDGKSMLIYIFCHLRLRAFLVKHSWQLSSPNKLP